MDALLADLRRANGRILWLMHVGADPDCLGSAYALREAFGGTIGAPEGLNKPAERLLRELACEIDTFPHPEHHDLVVAVDTASRSALGRLAPRVPAPRLVDHHRYGDLLDLAPAKAWDPARASCAEVVLALLDHARIEPSPRAARALLAGLVSDTARFRHADPAALRAAARLAERARATLAEVYAALEDENEEPDTLDLRRATLKAAARAELHEAGGRLVAVSQVGAFDAAAAAALVRAGADVALVAQERSDLARVSLRASTRVAGALHLGELANEAARGLGWSGGGHEGAAGLRGAPPAARAQAAVLEAVLRRLEGS